MNKPASKGGAKGSTSGGDRFWQRLFYGMIMPVYRWVKFRLDVIRAKFPGPFYSFWLHVTLFILVMGLPFSCQKEPAPLRIITVDLLPVKDITNVQQKQETPKEEKKEAKQEEKKAAPKSAPEPEEKKPEPVPAPKPIKKPEIKPEKKKEEKKPEKKDDKKKKEKPEDFDTLMKSIEEMAKKSEGKEKKATDEDAPKAHAPTTFDADKPISVSEIDAIISQISKCWTIPAGAKDIQNIAVAMRVSLREDGGVIRVEVVERGRYNSADEAVFRAAADAARRAVLKCSPLKGLPLNKYNQWKELEINFDPREMIF